MLTPGQRHESIAFEVVTGRRRRAVPRGPAADHHSDEGMGRIAFLWLALFAEMERTYTGPGKKRVTRSKRG